MHKLVFLALLAISGAAHASPPVKGAESIAVVSATQECPAGQLSVTASWNEAPGQSLLSHVQDAGPSVFCAAAKQPYPPGTSVVIRVSRHHAQIVRQYRGPNP